MMIIFAVMWVGLSSCRSYIGKNCFERAEYDAFSLSTDISPADGRKVLPKNLSRQKINASAWAVGFPFIDTINADG